MQNNEQFSNGRSKEDEYFHRRDRELIEESRRCAEAESHFRSLSAASGILDQDILNDLRHLGYDPKTVTAFPLVPLVQVAWSDGQVNPQERERIFHIARLHGMENEDPGWRTLALYLDNRPSDEDFRVTLRALKASFEALSAEDRERRKRDLILHCMFVASASGGFLGFGKISEVERHVIDEIEEAVRTI